MGERRIRRTFYTSRGRLAGFRARLNNLRAAFPINKMQPPDDPRTCEFYKLLTLRMDQRIEGASYRVAP